MLKLKIVFLITLLSLIGCSSNPNTYSILTTEQSFKEAATPQNTKVDLLWIVDNSDSMATSQQNLTQNFPNFISQFLSRNLDFQIAVTTTDAYLADPAFASFFTSANFLYDPGENQAHKAKFRDGVTSHTGEYILTAKTPNLIPTFVTNALEGTLGYGDERAWQSMKVSLASPLNAGFLRSGSFLAVVNISDEEDSSWDGTTAIDGSSNDPNLYSVNSMVSYFNQITASTSGDPHYSFNNIGIQDTTCLNALKSSFTSRQIGTRSNALADATGGAKLDICGDFASGLQHIAEVILQAATQFHLTRTPIENTISVKVNGVVVPQGTATSDGWTYRASSNSILFSGRYIPANGDVISVSFDPTSLNF